MEDYFTELRRKEADLVLLVLASQGISADYVKKNDSFDIIIKNRDEKIAGLAIEKFFAENNNAEQKYSEPPLSWQSPAVFIIMIALSLIHYYLWHSGTHWQTIKEYGSSGLYIMQKEYFRGITALMLHADIEHLAGNLVGLFIFATGVFSMTGYGRGSLLILSSGFLGNITNAYFKKGAYLSIGASTCVLGAAGILTALQIFEKRKTSISTIRIFAPFAAGMALLGLLSGGENTDISAHLFGFLWGFFLGIIYKTIFTEKNITHSDNVICSLAAITIILSAWMKWF